MEFIPANGNNYKVGRDGQTVQFVIIHTVVGTQQSAITSFQNPARIASAHYIVDYNSPRVVQMVRESDTAYHAGNWTINTQSIGIEHADNGAYNDPRPDVLYETSASLVADICKRYSIPIDRSHIKMHREVSLSPTACPDSLDIDRIVTRAKQISTPPPPAPDWQINRHPIGSHVRVIEKDVALIDLNTGSIVKTFPAGATIEVAYKTVHAGREFYQTQYSAEHNAPNGFPVDEFDYTLPAPMPLPPVETTTTTITLPPFPYPEPPTSIWHTDIIVLIRRFFQWLGKVLGGN